MKSPFTVASVTLLLGGCIPSQAGEETSQGQLVSNRPDGVLLNQQHSKLVTRWRGPMDHGGGVQDDHIDFRVWEARLTGESQKLESHPVRFVWRRGWFGTGTAPELRNPIFMRVGGKYIPNGCFDGTISSVSSNGTTCLPASKGPQVVQLGGRSENIPVSGHYVTFADGLDGNLEPCTLDLRQIAPSADIPITGNINDANYIPWDSANFGDETGPAFRFAVSYLPPQNAFVIDYGQKHQPIYRATCQGFEQVSQVLPLADGIIKSKSKENTSPVRVLDIVADKGRDQPALFLAVPDGDYGHRMVVIRSGKMMQAIPYSCHDCLPEIGGFFLGSPDWLLFDARLIPQSKAMTVSLKLFDLNENREVTRTVTAPDNVSWPRD